MSKTSLGFGIVGVGMIADYHARAIAEANGAHLVGVAGRSAAKVADFAARHKIGFSTTDVAALLARPDVSVVCIATPSGAHLEPALAAVAAGKHLVVEKPVEITLARVDELLAAAQHAGVRVAAIFQARFGPGAHTLKQAIAAGRFGRIALASAYVKWYRKPEYYQDSWHGTKQLDGGGALMNQGIHAVDLLQWFVGLPEQVTAWTTRRVHTGIEVEDTAAAALRFRDGALGVIEASTAHWPGWSRRIEIGGEFGSATLEDDRLAKWDFRNALPEDEAIRNAPVDTRLGGGATAPNAISHEGHLRQIQDLVDAIQAGRPLAVDGRDARNAVALIRAIYDSAASGRPVALS
jgi:UDP-N-acetyl-2-amino-2-deoxyglucuronate dehydrogenase